MGKIRTIQVVEPQIIEKNENNPGFTAKTGENWLNWDKKIVILHMEHTLHIDFSEIF